MLFALRCAVVVCLLILLTTPARAIDVKGPEGPLLSWLQQLVSSQLEPLILRLEPSTRTSLHRLSIHMQSNLPVLQMALAYPGEQPRIVINSASLIALQHYAEAQAVAEISTRADWPEYRIGDYFERLHSAKLHSVQLQGQSKAYSDHDDLVLSPAQYDRVLQRREQLLQAVVLDILLHELGHHAKGAFYSHWADKHERQIHEQAADHWAQRVWQQHLVQVEPVGRLLAIAFIFETERAAAVLNGRSDFALSTQLEAQLEQQCAPESSAFLSRKSLCAQLQQTLPDYIEGDLQSLYQQRLFSGDLFAAFPLAHLEMASSNFVEACNYFNESLIYGQVARAAIYVGWCYQQGYLKPSELQEAENTVLALIQ